MKSMRQRLTNERLLRRIVAGAAADGLLTSLQIQDPEPAPPSAREEGKVLFGVVEQALGVFDLSLIPPGQGDPRPYVLAFEGPPNAYTGFRLAVSLNDGPQKPLFELLPGLAGQVMTAAQVKNGPDSEWLEPLPGVTTQLTGTGVWLVLEGHENGAIAIKLSPNSDPPDDILTLGVAPPAALLGGSGFGLSMPAGVSLDQAEAATAPGAAAGTPAATPSWQGIVVPNARLFLPRGVPFLGGHAVDAEVQIGLAPTPGIDLAVQTTIPPKDGRPAISVRIECRDPEANGLADFLPTLVELGMELPLDGRQEPFTGGALSIGAGKPVRVRATYARKPSAAGAPYAAELSLALESQGPAGLVRIDSGDGNLGSKIAVTAATLATALIANGVDQEPAPDGDGSGVILETLLTAAVGLSAFLESGQVVLHRAEFITAGGVIPAGKAMRLKIDYSVAATVTAINVGVMSLQMHPNQPLRVRVREVVLTIDPGKSGLEMIHLDFARSSLEIEDPGGWQVKGPGSLFDVLGTRSGRGSMWIEVDLRFKLDLGPVKVSGATIRATLDAQGKLSGSLRGLDASINLEPLIEGRGGVQLKQDGFSAALLLQIKPLGLGARGDVDTAADMVKLSLGVDLPGPLPLGNTGLGIYGMGGVFAANGRPAPVPPGKDAIQHQLDWDYRQPGSFVPAEAFSFGLEAVVGTAVDMGFTFSARAGLFITTPDIAVRGSLNGRFMGERVKITRDDEGGAGIRAKGVVVVDPSDGVTVAVEGTYSIPQILEIVIPIAARFPKSSPDWYIHFGADGWTPTDGAKSEGRERGPVRAVVLPDLLGQQADAYLMFRGSGITKWPRGEPGYLTVGAGNFVAAFGFGFDIVMGVKPIVWAEVFARADILITTNPMTLVGRGKIGGGLHVGIFSVGVDASVHVVLVEGKSPYFLATVCGTIDLFLDEIHECVEIEINAPPTPELPAPAHPLDASRGQALVDDSYAAIAALPTDRNQAPVVWADAIPLLTFATAPTLALPAGQFPDAAKYPESVRARPLGGDLLSYTWELTGVTLVDSTNPANEVQVAGPLSCSWLKGKFGDAGGQPQPAELALLTPSGDLWLNALADAGSSLPHKPLDDLANVCQARVSPRLGWALGAGATREGDAWRMPPDPLSTDPLQSQVRALAEVYAGGHPELNELMLLDLSTAPFLPPPFGYAPPRVHAIALARFDDRTFDAYLEPGLPVAPPGRRDGSHLEVELRITADEPLAQARVWLVVERSTPGDGQPLSVVDNLGQSWAADQNYDLGGDLIALRWRPPAPVQVSVVHVRTVGGVRLGVIGLGGITKSAADASAARNAASQAEAQKQQQAATNGPPKPNTPPSTTKRCTLEPGKVYRLGVDMRWSGVLSRIDDKGKKVAVAEQKADGSTNVERSYWFRTAPASTSVVPSQGTTAYVEHLYRKRELFEPAMLVRHLRGYEPYQSELHRFANDPVRVHFAHGHVAALAGAYGFDLLCGLRRLDAPATEEADRFIVPELRSPASTDFLTGPAKTIAKTYLESPCQLAPPGLVLHAPVQLTRSTWYEVYVHAKSKNPNTMPDGSIPGVSFRTSRWGDGAEMLAALRFPVAGTPGAAHGGAALRPDAVLTPQSIESDDSAFDALLLHLGLDGWPSAAEPRVSVLWREMGMQWRCVGVLIESPEPIHRPGRFHVDMLQLRMGTTSAVFDVRARDRSGSRLLFATTAPFLPRMMRVGIFGPMQPPALRLDCTDLPIGSLSGPLKGWLTVPLEPSFAEEVA